jgi:hypothetical protein
VKGTNPGQAAIENLLTDFVSQHVACQESRYQHFVAPREGGIGFPNVGIEKKSKKRVGGVGIMQLYDPPATDTQVWNWRENVKEGLKRLNKNSKQANNAYLKERDRLNTDRKKLGLPICPEGIPTHLNPDQLMRETIRRYNCGVEYRWEPRDAANCAGRWVVYHSCKNKDGKDADLDYVDNVLKCKL